MLKLLISVKQKICNFFVVPEIGKALLGMPDIKILDILTINCNTIGTQEPDKADKCSPNTATSQGSGCEQHFTNTRQEPERPEKHDTNTDSNSNSKSNKIDNPTVNNNEINYFLPGSNQGNDKTLLK